MKLHRSIKAREHREINYMPGFEIKFDSVVTITDDKELLKYDSLILRLKAERIYKYDNKEEIDLAKKDNIKLATIKIKHHDLEYRSIKEVGDGDLVNIIVSYNDGVFLDRDGCDNFMLWVINNSEEVVRLINDSLDLGFKVLVTITQPGAFEEYKLNYYEAIERINIKEGRERSTYTKRIKPEVIFAEYKDSESGESYPILIKR